MAAAIAEVQPYTYIPYKHVPRHYDTHVLHVTPQMAQAWMDAGMKNRPVQPKTVQGYANQMAAGEWKLNGQPLIFNTSGKLIDGQHRLLAIVRSEATVPMLVVFGIDQTAFTTLDTGRKRSTASVLQMEGYAYANALAAIATRVMAVEQLGHQAIYDTSHWAQTRATPARVLEYVNNHPDLLPWVAQAHQGARAVGMPGSMLGALLYVFSTIDANDTRQYWAYLSSGADMDVAHPILQFRNRLAANSVKTTNKMTPATMSAMAIKAWNYWRTGKRVSFLQWQPTQEPFPTIETEGSN